MPVIDASVYVALVNASEPDHVTSMAWYRRTIEDHKAIIAPGIILAEVAAALSRGLGDAARAHQTVERLSHSKVVMLVPVSNELARLAADIAAEHRVRGCDAIYIALAKQTGEALVTLDQQQFTRGSAAVHTLAPV
jgi:predicted nucleic acid-binding protein